MPAAPGELLRAALDLLAAAPAAPALACGLLLCALGSTQGAARDGYTVRTAQASLDTLLDPHSDHWAGAEKVNWGPARYATEFRALRTDEGLAVRFLALDDEPWHTLDTRDDPIWNEEVVEIFIDPDGDGRNYAEIEISPANVLCDLQIFTTEPSLRSDIGWDFAGIATRVTRVDGSGGAPWIATAALPWEGFAALRDTAVRLPPEAGDTWSFNVFRIKRPYGPEDPERDALYAPWSPTPSLSFHAPAAFRPLRFAEGR